MCIRDSIEVAGILDDRDDEALLGVHRDAQVLGTVVDDPVTVDAGVDRGVRLEGLSLIHI